MHAATVGPRDTVHTVWEYSLGLQMERVKGAPIILNFTHEGLAMYNIYVYILSSEKNIF